MNNHIVPASYTNWRHCIEVDCGLRLDLRFIELRLSALEDTGDPHTQQFVRRWGEPHRETVVAWFRQAHDELGSQTLC